MSEPINDGGSAFPNPPKEFWYGTNKIESFDKVGGMTLRDWFAKEGAKIYAENLMSQGYSPANRWDEVCREGLNFADAMLAARKDQP